MQNGKKRIKATTNRLRNAAESPAIAALRRTVTESKLGPALSLLRRPSSLHAHAPATHAPPPPPPAQRVAKASIGTPVWAADYVERSPLQPPASPADSRPRRPSRSYGSVGVSPGFSPGDAHGGAPSLRLPEPMQPIETHTFEGGATLERASSQSTLADPLRPGLARSATAARDAHPLRRLFTLRGRGTLVQASEAAGGLDEVQAEAEKEFLQWLLAELRKCEAFYAAREAEFVARFDEMREQLDIMRDRWFKAKHSIPFEDDDAEDDGASGADSPRAATPTGGRSRSRSPTPTGPAKKRVGWKSFADTMNGLMRAGPTTAQIDTGAMHVPEGTRDYVRRAPARKPLNNPVHRVAKHKLKRAYIEYYHSLEMLKSYVTVNRECFRKITKKFDKASGLRTSNRFMVEYVDKSKFGGANNGLDELLNDTESLFARFFERGNRKEASARLRSRENKTVYYASVWKTGYYIGATTIIGAYGLYQAVQRLEDKDDPARALKTSYLLQVSTTACV